VNQINAAIGNLDQMTQQNAALVEQSAAAATSMNEQAAQLTQVVSVFRLNDGDSGAAPRATSAPAPAPRPTASGTNRGVAAGSSGASGASRLAAPKAASKPAANLNKPRSAAAPKAALGNSAAATPAPAASSAAARTPKQDDGEWDTF
ncbi:MAG: hypothetical protein MUE43_09535, partial [Serpentinimonas sp.]|nr:hypothetical protein [Serpentinimonas sp.]